MRLLHTVQEMREWSERERAAGRRIAFVPTMGALHEGHLSLLREGKKRGDRLVISIYVNPTQFAPTEDLGRYPRDLEGDLAKSAQEGADAAFLPSDDAIYPAGFQTFVTVEELSKPLCGASRPTHFRGVTTVVLKLFNIISPHVAIFGEKDFQQLAVIRRMVRDLDLSIDIVGCPIVREADGVAMSSRNRYLNQEERRAATSLSRSLAAARQLIEDGALDAEAIIGAAAAILAQEELVRIDYLRLIHAQTLADLPSFQRPALLALAAFIGKTRLIDNASFPA